MSKTYRDESAISRRGRAGGLIGGPARAKKLTADERRAIASMGGKACQERKRRDASGSAR